MQSLPNKGIASDTWGNVSATRLRNTVSDRRIVTPVTEKTKTLQTKKEEENYFEQTIKYTSSKQY